MGKYVTLTCSPRSYEQICDIELQAMEVYDQIYDMDLHAMIL